MENTKNKFTITTKNKAIDKLKSLIFLGLIIIIIAINLNMNIKKIIRFCRI